MEMRDSVLYISEEAEKDYFAEMLYDNYILYTAKNEEQSFYLLNDSKINISVIIVKVFEFNKTWSDFVKKIADDKRLCMIPIVAVVKCGNRDNELTSLISGVTDYLKEPIDKDILRCRINNVINSRKICAISNNRVIDALTTLPTKSSFEKKASLLLKNNPDIEYDIIYSDIDNFQLINVMFGIHKADEILKKIAKKYIDNMDENEACARIGSDHFVALIKRRDSDHIEDFLKKLTLIDEDQHYLKSLDIKFGIYKIKDRDRPIPEMYDRASIALKTTKNKYGVYYAWYNEELYLKLLNEQYIVKNMEEALLNNHFKVFFQPKYNINNDKIMGAEALVRWIHPEKGMIYPDKFIPIFEKNGFISKLDLYVLEEVCKRIRLWIDEGYSVVPVSVNISREDLYRVDIVKTIEKLADKYGIDYRYIHLEITESAYTDNPDQIIEKVKTLREMGIIIEMDDFGTGYSSLNMLSELPIDVLKLDASFVRRDFFDFNTKNIIGFVISLAKWMNLKVIAEGVETKEQIDRLKNLECNFVQGYFYAKPVPADEFISYLKDVDDENKNINTSLDVFSNETVCYGEDETKRTILIVEDMEVNRNILIHMLKDKYNLVEASNGKAAYDYLLNNKSNIDAIILDLIMPVMNGFQFIKKLRNNKDICDIPVIIASESGEKSELSAIQIGANAFVPKPYDDFRLIHKIESVIGNFYYKKHTYIKD